MPEKDSEYTLARQNNQQKLEENEGTASRRTTSRKKWPLD